jgi:hypothetical protein
MLADAPQIIMICMASLAGIRRLSGRGCLYFLTWAKSQKRKQHNNNCRSQQYEGVLEFGVYFGHITFSENLEFLTYVQGY